MKNYNKGTAMKIRAFVIALAIAIAGACLLTSCSHNVGTLGIGTGFRAGGSGYGIDYGEGLFGTFVTKDGIRFKAELDSTTGFSYDPSTNSYKGIRSIEYSLPPQITGYAVDFAKENPEVAKAYYEALMRYYGCDKQATEEKPATESESEKQ